jgi:hypothetical protein
LIVVPEIAETVTPAGMPVPKILAPTTRSAGSKLEGEDEKERPVLPTATVLPFMIGIVVAPTPLKLIVLPEIAETVAPAGMPVPKILAPTTKRAGFILEGGTEKESPVLPTATVTSEFEIVAATLIVMVLPEIAETVAPAGIPVPKILAPTARRAGFILEGGEANVKDVEDADVVAVGDINPVVVAVGDINPVVVAAGVTGMVVELGAIPKLQLEALLHKLLTDPMNLFVGIIL